MLNDRQRKRVFNIIIVNQCLGMLTSALFQNGFYLNYFTRLGFSSADFALMAALPSLVGAFLLIPFAFYSDRFGKKRLALVGQILIIVNLALTMVAGWWNPGVAIPLAVVALLLFCVGGSLQNASWFAMLNPIVPPEIRGRFFGRLRVTFQSVSILFTILTTRLLEASQAMLVFQLLLGLVLLAAIVRYFTYARIPELENAGGEKNHREHVFKALRDVLSVPGYLRFGGYIFAITFFTASVPIIFGLMQKDVFGFDPAQITLMGTLVLVGSMIGCGLGGRITDRYGVRFVFRSMHVAYITMMLVMLSRHWAPWPLPVHVGGCVLLFSLVTGLAGVAVTAQTLSLIPAANKSLSSAATMTLLFSAFALSGLFVSRALEWSFLPHEWYWLGQTGTIYDILLLLFAGGSMLMTVGWVPCLMNLCAKRLTLGAPRR